MADVSPQKLRDLLRQHFTLPDLEDLCFEMDVSWDDVRGETLSEKARELTRYCQSQGRLPELLVHARRLRPAVDWTAETRADPAPVGLVPAASPPAAPHAAAPHAAAPLAAADNAAALTELQTFKALLDESWALFLSHNQQRGRLAQLLVRNHRAELPPFEGYDDLFYKMHDAMNEDETALFRIVRGNTRRGTHRMNSRILEWVEAHPIAALLPERTAAVAELEAQVLALKVHLEEWFAKYEDTFLPDEKRTLVYLDDEKKHGKGWPKELLPAVAAAIAGLGG